MKATGHVNGIDPNLVFFVDELLNRWLGTSLRNYFGHALSE